MKMLKCFIMILPVLFLVGCSDSGDAPTAPTGGGTPVAVSYATDILPLITGSGCLGAGCHGGSSSSGGLSLGTGEYSDVRNAVGGNGAIIVADSALSSNFYLKLTASPPFGSRMPLGGTPLSTTNLNKIRDWINEGALDN